MDSFSFDGTHIDWSSTFTMEIILGDVIDKLNQLKKPINLEKDIKSLKN